MLLCLGLGTLDSGFHNILSKYSVRTDFVQFSSRFTRCMPDNVPEMWENILGPALVSASCSKQLN